MLLLEWSSNADSAGETEELIETIDQPGGRQVRWRGLPFLFRQSANAWLLLPAKVAPSL